MRKCPRCGTEYADTDFRTMCGSCLVNLVPMEASDTATPKPVTGPVRVESANAPVAAIPLTITLVEIVMPELTLPEVSTPELPASPEATLAAQPALPEPGPIPAPLTPQPNPAIPQPPIIPLPSPEQEPVPVPVPVPQPQPRPQPDEPHPTAGAPQVRRVLNAAELSEGRGHSTLAGLGAVVVAILLLFQLHGLGEDFSFFGLLWLGILVAGLIALVRVAIFRSAIHSIKVAPLTPLCLGVVTTIEVTIRTLRELPIDAVQLRFVAEERAEIGSGKSRRVYTHSLFDRTAGLPTLPRWPGERELVFATRLTVPVDAIPSFSGRSNGINWRAELWVGIPGWYPDIRQTVPLTVLPVRTPAAPLPMSAPAYTLPELKELNARIAFTCPVTERNMPIFQPGQRIPFILSIAPGGSAPAPYLWVELGYRVSGSGSTEFTQVANLSFPTERWSTGRCDGELTLPPASPITYTGTHVKIAWSITVRQAISWHQDRRQIFEVKVVPACAE